MGAGPCLLPVTQLQQLVTFETVAMARGKLGTTPREFVALCRAYLAPCPRQNSNGLICTCKSATPHLTRAQRQPAGAPQTGASAVRRTRRTLKALAISTACTSARPMNTLW